MASFSVKDILEAYGLRKAARMANAPEIKHFFGKKDLTAVQSILWLWPKIALDMYVTGFFKSAQHR